MKNETELFNDVADGHVINTFDPANAGKLHPNIKELIGYIQNNAENKARPKRKDLDPADIVRLIPNISILDIRYEGNEVMDVYVRLMGTAMVKVYGEKTGKMLSDFRSKIISQRMYDTCDMVVKSKSVVVGSVSSFDEEKNFLKLLKVKIPLFDDDNNPDRVTQIISLIVFSA